MKKNNHLYLGKAGYLTIMAEFLVRGWNVVKPKVDIGDGIFVVQDENRLLKCVQVMTSTSTSRKNGFSAQFQVPLIQLTNANDLYYVFMVRHNDRWTKPVIINQKFLLDYYQNSKIGTESNGNLNLYFSYSTDKVECSGFDLTKYVSDYSDFPIIED